MCDDRKLEGVGVVRLETLIVARELYVKKKHIYVFF